MQHSPKEHIRFQYLYQSSGRLRFREAAEKLIKLTKIKTAIRSVIRSVKQHSDNMARQYVHALKMAEAFSSTVFAEIATDTVI